MNETLHLIEVITTISVGVIIPFVVFCVVSIVTLKTDMKWLLRITHANGEANFLGSHSPTDHFELDFYVDKYKQHHGDLPYADWLVIKSISRKCMDNPDKQMEDRSRARMNFEFACHKLQNCPNLSFVNHD